MKNIYNQNLIQLYKTALMEIKKHLAVFGSRTFEEAIISKDSIELLKKIFASIPKMYSKFIAFVDKEENTSAFQQVEFMIKELEKIRETIKSIKETIGSHKNDCGIEADDFARIQRLDALAAEQISDLNDHKIVLEDQVDHK